MAYRMLGCEHYSRKCQLLSPCCNKFYSCRICHDERADHKMDRKLVERIKCLVCEEIQLVRKSCARCGLEFGKYFCKVCNLFDDEEKQQFHCYGCGICRVGGREQFFHCINCDMCLSMDLKKNHVCVDIASRLGCSYCGEDIHSSRSPIKVPKCGHLIHSDCLEKMKEDGLMHCLNCRRHY